MYSDDQLNDLRNKVLANRSARERGEPEPHAITSETLRSVVEQLQAGRSSAVATTKAAKEDKIEATDASMQGW